MKFDPVIKWSGSKRSLSEDIIKNFPKQINTYYEPFCGGCSVLFQLINSDISIKKYVCSDLNKDLIDIFLCIKEKPIILCDEYEKRWNELKSFEKLCDKQKCYNEIRDQYNKTKNIYDFYFLSRTSCNGLIRYNSNGMFNASLHLNRDGINPHRLKKIITLWSNKLNEKSVNFVNCSYNEINPIDGDYAFLDPPYHNTKGMYYGVIDFNCLWEWIKNLKCNFSLTFDGKRGDIDNTFDVPKDIYTNHIYLESKISGFKKLHKDVEYVRESLYIK